MTTASTPYSIPLRLALCKWYLNRGMHPRLAEAVIVCGYLEALLAGVPAVESRRLKPVFDTDLELLREDWMRCRYFNLWHDTVTGEITASQPPGDGEPLPSTIEALPEADQRAILFSRFGYLFA
jgi:hypothetical protein